MKINNKVLFKLNKFYRFFIPLYISTFIFFQVPAFSIEYPEYTGDNVVDLSQKFDNRYIDSLKSDLNQSEYEVRVVFIKTDNNINLAFYAPKLFEKWNMPQDSILVVIDPYLNKIGYGIGQKVREDMKKRGETNQQPKSENKQTNKSVDYDNLATAIFDKFSPSNAKIIEKKSDLKTQSKENKDNNITGTTTNTKSNSDSKNAIYISPLIKKIIYGLLALILLLGTIYFIYKRKKHIDQQGELKTNYLFDADMKKQEIIELIDKINRDMQKMGTYNGKTKKEVQTSIEKLHSWKNKGELFIAKMDSELEDDIDIEELGYVRELLDEGSLIKDELEKAHKEALEIRRDFKSTLKKAGSYASDIRVNLENCKFAIDTIKTIYNLDLSKSEEKIIEFEKEINQINQFADQNNPLELKQINHDIHDKIRKLKKDLEVIPHLYKQLNESIPTNIEDTINNSNLENDLKLKKKKEINDLRSSAINSLTVGDLETGQELVKNIFDEINSIKSESTLKN